jgi:hypothetical protein
VIEEVQRGYRLGDRVLRPALVRVANNPSSAADGSRTNQDPTNPNTGHPKEN